MLRKRAKTDCDWRLLNMIVTSGPQDNSRVSGAFYRLYIFIGLQNCNDRSHMFNVLNLQVEDNMKKILLPVPLPAAQQRPRLAAPDRDGPVAGSL